MPDDTPDIRVEGTPELPQGGPPTQPSTPPPRMGGRPLLLDYISQMIRPRSTPPSGPINPQEEPARPPSRTDLTLDFMGHFLTSLASGLAASGHGPGANTRGFAGAMLAQHQQAVQQWQLQQQQQEQQSQIENRKSQAAFHTPSIAMIDPEGNQVMVPPSAIGQALAAQYRMAGQGVAAQSRKEVADTRAESVQETAQAKIKSAEAIAAENRASREKIASQHSTTRQFIAGLQADIQRQKVAGLGTKVPPPVSKAFGDYQDSVSRLNIMQQNYERGSQGDQQAMLSLLANHIGMTMGLAKGARITQAIIREAEQSAPVVGRIQARFDSRGILSGVVLTPEQMGQMVELAKGRVEQDNRKFKAVQEFHGPGAGGALTNFSRNPATGQVIGWNGKNWVDKDTGKLVQ